MLDNKPTIVEALNSKTFKYKKGCVYFHNLYQKKLNQKHKREVDQTYTLSQKFADCLYYEVITPLQSNGNPNICDCLNAHSDKYRKGKVPIEMIFKQTNKQNQQSYLPTVIDAMNGHNNKFKHGKVQLSDIYQPKRSKHIIEDVYIDLSEVNREFNFQVDSLGIA